MNDLTIQHYADRPAFPIPGSVDRLGLTRREWFAAHAPEEIPTWFVANGGWNDKEDLHFKWRVYWADKMIKELYNP